MGPDAAMIQVKVAARGQDDVFARRIQFNCIEPAPRGFTDQGESGLRADPGLIGRKPCRRRQADPARSSSTGCVPRSARLGGACGADLGQKGELTNLAVSPRVRLNGEGLVSGQTQRARQRPALRLAGACVENQAILAPHVKPCAQKIARMQPAECVERSAQGARPIHHKRPTDVIDTALHRQSRRQGQPHRGPVDLHGDRKPGRRRRRRR